MGTGIADDVVEELGAAASHPGEGEDRPSALSRPLIIAGLILATALSALDSTIITTALPTIVGVLGGLPLYSLVVAAFLLTATTTVPLYGKLSDMYGRKPVFMFGVALFIVGSALCGLAWDMPSLIAFRALQGLGAGAIVPVSLTIIGDLFEIEERARLQGIFGSVWGVSSIVGPLVGGAIVQFFDWRWVFFINVPVGILAALLVFLSLREPAIHNRERVDVAGAVTLTLGVGLVLVGLQSGSRSGWASPVSLLIWAGALLLLALFGFFERRAASPVLSLSLLRRPVIAVPCVAGLLAGGVLIGYAAYVPLLVQGAWGGTPIEAGLIIAPMSIGWPLASTASGRLIRRFGYYTPVVGGMLLILLGTAMPITLRLIEDIPLKAVIIGMASAVTGAGFGASTTSMLIALQVSVPWRERGIATASAQFFRNMGQAVGATVLGVVLTVALTPILASERVQALAAGMPAATKVGADPTLGPINVLFDLDLRLTLAPETRGALQSALADSLWWVFGAMLLMAAVGALVATRFPREVQTAEGRLAA